MSAARACAVCGSLFEGPVYRSPEPRSITSLGDVHEGRAEVFFCGTCEHVQTAELDDLDDYYDQRYEILLNSEEQDDLYEVRDGARVFRSEHQSRLILQKVPLPQGARLLDFGCAKGITMRRVLNARPDLQGHLFDVSERYVPYWEKFLAPSRWSTYTPPEAWTGSFDAILSLFVLEHVARPPDYLERVARLLAPGGTFFFIVPNLLTNRAEMVAVDHVNHFTRASLRRALDDVGLEVREICDASFRGAFVVTAGQDASASSRVAVDPVKSDVEGIAAFWCDVDRRIAAFEDEVPDDARFAIYGAGFYGAYVYSALARTDRVACFVDRNPHLCGTRRFDVPVVAPEDLDGSIERICVAVNPDIARDAIASIGDWSGRSHHYFYL